MIIVRIERWPDDADPEDARQRYRRTDIAQAVITNDHSGDRELGNYSVTLYDPPPYNPWGGVERTGRIEGFPRREKGSWQLVYQALQATLDANEAAASTSHDQSTPINHSH